MGAQAVRLSNVDIDNAIKNKDFEVLFQPIFDLGNGALARMETFVRWRHKTLGLLPPGAFISFFETQGRMSELTRYVLSAALEAYMDWRGAYPPGFSINLALSDLGDEAFVGHFQKLLRDRNFPADLVTLECPMPPVDMDADVAAAQFKALSETGARLAIEVRGRANEFLRTVKPFPFDEIKTGGASILRFARTVRGPGLSAIADLLDIAHQANAAITAVGVEDQTSLVALRGLGFTAAQGNHLGKVGGLKDFMPGKVNDVRALLKLDPLDADSLNALFRSAAPGAEAGVLSSSRAADAAPTNTMMADRAKQSVVGADAETQEAERKTRARDKARKLALAKRAKTRNARKAAAIERVKAKTAAQSDLLAELPALDVEDLPDAADVEDGDPFGPGLAPRDMQQRIAKEFTQQEDDHGEAPAGDNRAAPSPAPETSAQQQPKAAKAPSPLSDEKVTEPPVKGSAKGVVKADPAEDKIDRSEAGGAKTAAKTSKAAPKPEAPLQKRPAMADKAPSAAKPPPRPKPEGPEPGRPAPDQPTPAAQAVKPAASLLDAAPPQPKDSPAKAPPASSVPMNGAQQSAAAIKMNVPTAGARLLPELRVSGPRGEDGLPPEAVSAPLETSPPPPSQAPITTPPPEPARPVATAAAPLASDDAAPVEIEPPRTETDETPPLAAPARKPDIEEDVLFGDLHQTEEADEETPALPLQRGPKRKNFLTRKYRLAPTHFWPKSWKRRYRRMKARQAAARRNDEASADSPSTE